MPELKKLIVLLLALCVFGCSGHMNYQNTLEKNVLIKTKVASDSIFSSIKPILYVYKVINDCEIEYLGEVKLSKSEVDVGIQAGQKNYLEFAFLHSTMGQDRGSTRYGTTFTPKFGYKYDIEVSYEDNYYDVYIVENGPKSKNKELDREYLKKCS